MSQLKGQTLPMSQPKDQTLQVLQISLVQVFKVLNVKKIVVCKSVENTRSKDIGKLF